ncbi:MAG: 30S ribosomal protein S8 [Ardenticatenaceae bacterium]|nr:30S ribosomal protein S8 [Ardenticatenaceae bacterium]
MSMSDPVADMLTRIRNAIMRQHKTVVMPTSKLKTSVAEVLKDEGYIKSYEVLETTPFPMLQVDLKYVGDKKNRRSVIAGLQRISKPGRRVYVGKKEIPWVLSGMGIAIVTTSRGVMTGQNARRLGVGGEVLCKVW